MLVARADAPAAGGAHRRDRRALRRQPLLRRGARRCRGRPGRRAPARPARPAATACQPPRPSDAEPVAPRRGRRARRRLPAAPRRRRRSRSPRCASRCGGPSSTASSSSEQATGSFRFRHALLAEAIYATILPGEREELHARLAHELARSGDASPAELAPHWAAAGRSAEALAASVDAARQAEAVFGLAEAHAHLERALALWPAVPDADELAGLDLAGLCAWTGELAGLVGAAPRAVELARQAIELVGAQDPYRAALLHVGLGEYLLDIGSKNGLLAAFERAVELVPAEPPSPERAYALGSLAGGLMVDWRYAESLPIAEQALALARGIGAREAEVRALTVLGGDLAYLGRGEEGLTRFRQALQLAEEIGDHLGLERAYANFTDALTMLGRPRESARLGAVGARGAAPVRDPERAARLEPDRGAARDRRLGRGGKAQRGRAPRHHVELPVLAAHHARGRRDRPRRLRRGASAPRGRELHAARGPRARPLRRPARRARPLGAPLDGRGRGHPRRVWLKRASARRRRSASSCARRDFALRRSWQRSHALAGTPTRSATGSIARGSC